ncbi:MAG: peptidylprolyl isomerase [Bacteroidia bacterium]
MKITQHTVATVSYHLQTPENGELITVERVNADNPALFLIGVGQLLPAFEAQLQGKQVGDAFEFTLSPEEGYGLYFEEDIVELPLTTFQDKEGKIDMEMLKVGSFIPMSDAQGNRFFGKVVAVTLEVVRMDFNHPLAGKTLNFSGEILAIRAAEQEELSHGHVHGPGGHQH